MNKLTKATIAGAAGIALLLGGAGSLAYWNTSATVTGSTITAGELTIVANGTPVWTDANGTINIAAFKAVPGDVLTFTANFDVTAVGDNLTATVALTGDSVTAADTNNPADVQLALQLIDAAVVTVNGVTTADVTPTGGTQTVVVSVTLTWPFGTATDIDDDFDAMNGKVNLSNMTITLTQTP